MPSYANGRTLRERLLSRLIIDPDSDCLLWTGALDPHGYGTIMIRNWKARVHRVTYEMFAGPIPEGLFLDHLCRVRHCASPAHLEPVTNRVNILRGETVTAANAVKTHCPRDHPYDEANTLVYRGSRYCRACRREGERKRWAAS